MSRDDADIRDLLDNCANSDIVLEWNSNQTGRAAFKYLRLWSEKSYHLSVDENIWIEVPKLVAPSVLIEREYHPALHRTDAWWYGPKLCSTVYRIGSTGETKSQRSAPTPILIPNIPGFLDALVFQKLHRPNENLSTSFQIRNLIRNLYLELPHQRDHLLMEVESSTERYLLDQLAQYKRKPRMIQTKTMRIVYVNEWDPSSYPAEALSMV